MQLAAGVKCRRAGTGPGGAAYDTARHLRTMSALADLLDLLDLERIETRLFRGRNRPLVSRRVYGGQVLAQALVAAGRTVERDMAREGAPNDGRRCHSLHAYFLLPGDVGAPIVYDVETLRDGGSFSTRRVTAIQHGRPIFNASLSFHRPEKGPEHQSDPAPGAPAPGGLASEPELAERFAVPEPVRAILTRDRPIDFRPVDPADPFAGEARPARSATWLRAAGAMPDDPLLHQALFAYASDWGLLGTATQPHGQSVFDGTIQAASLDHAVWFHRPFRADGWLLYAMEAPTAYGARGFARGAAYADGVLVASTAQEGLVRPVRPPGAR